MVKHKIRKYAVCLFAPAAVIVMLSAVFAAADIYPFGKNAISWCDMEQQVIPFMADLKNILAGDENIFLNFANGGGMNFWGVFLFFLSSPFSLLTAFVGKHDLTLFMNILVALKMAVCALTACLFFRYKTPSLKPYFHILLGVMYAFCGFSLLFYQNIMWLDIMYLFPLLMLSLDLLTKRNRPVLFIIVLTLCVAMNFYLSYMIVLCVVFYMGLYLILGAAENKKKTASVFCISSFIACLLSAPCWMPALFQYMQSARTTNVIESISSGGVFTYVYTVLPLLFCTAAVIPVILLAVKYLKEFEISHTFILFILTAVPLLIEPINKMWHTGNYMAFPARYGYMTAFFAITLLAFLLERYCKEQPVTQRKNKSRLPLLAVAVIALCAGASAVIYFQFDNIRAYTNTLWGDRRSFLTLLVAFLLFGVCYGGILLAIKKKKQRASLTAVLLAIVLLAECAVNSSVYIAAPRHTDDIFQNVMDLSGKIKEDTFFRVKTDKKRYDVNLTGAAGYRTLGHYSSLTPGNYMYTMKKLGYSAYWMETSSCGGTLFSDALLSNKYTIGDKFQQGAFYKNDMFSISKNSPSLLPCIVTGTDLSKEKTLPENADRMEVQQHIFKTLFGGELFTRFQPREYDGVQVKKNKNGKFTVTKSTGLQSVIRYQVPVTKRQTLYFDCFDRVSAALVEDVNNSVTVLVGGEIINESYPSQKENGILTLGSFENEMVEIEVQVNKDFACSSLGVFGLEEGMLEQTAEKAEQYNPKISGNTIDVSCNAKSGEYLFLAVPYDKGFTAEINGQPAQVNQVYSGFMAVKLNAGENHVVFSFVPRGFTMSLIICALGILLFILYAILRKKKQEQKGLFDRICYAAVTAGFFLLAAAVYIAPVLIKIFVR